MAAKKILRYNLLAVSVLVALLLSFSPVAASNNLAAPVFSTYRTWIAQDPSSPVSGQAVTVWVNSDTAFGETAGLQYNIGSNYVIVLGTWDTSYAGANWRFTIPAQASGTYVRYQLFTRNEFGSDYGWTGFNWNYTVGGPDCNIHWAETLHDSFNTDYRSSFGAVAAGSVSFIKLRLRVAQGDLSSARVRVWEDRTNTETYYNMSWDGTFDTDPTTYDYWYANIPVPTSATILYYFFELNDNGNGVCPSGYSADQDFYTDDDPKFYGGGYGAMGDSYDDSKSFQITVYDASFSVPSWMQRGVVYQIFPDRFRDGNTSNDPAAGEFFYGGTTIYRSNDTDWNTVICDPRSSACPSDYSNNFYGGDLAGITEKINAGYFDQLGVTVLYLNPIFSSPSNHKYDTADYMTIDPDFGTLSDFQTLVAAADAHGMRIILDGVFNHTSSDSTYFDYYSRYDAAGNLSSGDDNSGACEGNTSSFYDWFYFQIGSFGSENGGTCNNGVSDATQNYRAWYGYGSLPKLQANSTAVRNLIWNNGTSSVGPYWVSQGASGWRFDVGGDVDPGLTSDPSNDYWEGFRSAVRSVDSSTVTLGEEWGDASAWLLGNEWDSVMNYRYRSAVLSWLFTGCSGSGCTGGTMWEDNDSNAGSASGAVSYISPSQFNARLMAIEEDYPEQAWKAMMNLGDSHDTNRLRFVLRQINNGNDPAALQRMRELWLFAFTYAGAPTVYYGDEVGLNQDGVYSSGKYEDDPYNRAPFPWDDTTGDFVADTGLQDFMRTMSSIRQSYRALQDGDVVHGVVIDDTNQLYGYARTYGSQTALIVLNRSGSTHSVTLSGLTSSPYNLTNGETLVNALDGNTYTVSGGAVTVSVNPTWGVVLLEQSEIDTPAAPENLSETHTTSAVTLSWDLVSDDTASGVEVATSYTVYGSANAGFTPDSSTLLDTVAPPSFGSDNARVSYTDNHTGYFYAVCAVNAAGNENCTALPVAYDYGDLPDTYDTILTSDGARNAVPTLPNVYLGSSVDNTETDGTPTAAATGDDTSGTDDEDGVTFQTPIMPGLPYTIKVTASSAGYLNAWIDFNGDGAFGTGEQIATDRALSAGMNTLTFAAPSSTTPFASTLYSRFRFTASTAQATSSTGSAPNGEVEDYALMSVGDLVWNDNGAGSGVTGDGLMNGTEAGIQYVVLELLDGSGNAVNDGSATAITTTTDASGRYLFTGLNPGSYRVRVASSNFASGQPLYQYLSSAGQDSTKTTNENASVFSDNGSDSSLPASDGSVSSTFTLVLGGEPLDDQPASGSADNDANSNKTIDFGFIVTHTVTFDANLGSGTMSPQTEYTSTALKANTFTRSSYTFAGWGTAAGGPVVYANGATYSFAADITLYAQWTPVCSPSITVANNADNGAGSLRQAIADVCAGGTIDFDPGMSGQTITLTSGQLSIAKSMTINGLTSSPGVSVSGGNAVRVFYVSGGTVVINNLTIQNGRNVPAIGTIGGAGLFVNNTGTAVTLNSCAILNNATTTTAATGGGIVVNTGASLTMNNCTVSGNSSSYDSGGILNLGTLNVNNSTIVNNTTPGGGGGLETTTNTVTLNNTLLAGNSGPAGADCYTPGGSIQSTGYNMVGSTSGCTFAAVSSDVTGFSYASLLLGTLQNNGGPTSTYALLPGSPAINAGSGCSTTDQRGLSRVGTCDIGAFESQGFTLAISGGNGQSTPISTAFTNPLAVTVTANNAVEPVNGGRITFTAPASGASATLATSPATISGGATSVTATANATGGTYSVAASASGATGVSFSLTNTVAPSVTTGAATDITSSSATLNGTVNANGASTTVTFEYGADTSYGTTVTATGSPVSGTTATAISYALSGLAPNTTYHFRAVGVNVVGETDGADATFTTSCASAITVTNANNSGAGSLRQAIAAVCSGGTITFDGNYTILLASTLTINKNMTINGAGHSVTLDGQSSVRVLTVNSGVTATLNALTIDNGNSFPLHGGGIYSRGNLTVTNSTITDNYSIDGGGIYNYFGTLAVTNSTFSGNEANLSGGGLYNYSGTLTVTNSTLSGNTAYNGGAGLYNYGTLHYTNTIIANSLAGEDCLINGGSIPTNVNNLVENGGCSDNGVNFRTGDPNLGTLQNNGGTTLTFALLAGSPAIDAGTNTGCPTLDQRGVSRPLGASCDIGAYEYQDSAAPAVSTFLVTTPVNSLTIPITAFSGTDDVAVSGYLVTESSTQPAAGAAGWTSAVPGGYTVSADGSYTLYPWVKDASGNVSALFATPRTAVVDTTGPTITINNPDTLPATSKTITASTSDGTLSMSNTTGATCDGTLAFVAYASQTFTSEANNGIRVCYRAVDALGNTAYSLSAAIAGIDTSAPVITITEPNTDPATSKTITASTSDGTLSMSNTTGTTCDGTLAFVAYASQTFTSEANNGIRVCYRAVDALGNTSYSLSNAISGIDTTAPTITINNPDTLPATSKTITASTSDGTLSMSNTTGATCDGTLAFVAYASQTFTSEANNGIRVCYRAVDALGNTAYGLSAAIAGIDTTSIEVALSGGVIGNPGTLEIINLQTYTTHFTQIIVTFTADANNPADDTDPDDVTNPRNYLLIQPGLDGEYDTPDCHAYALDGLYDDDTQVPTGPVTYSNTDGYVATVTVNGGTPLPSGSYRLYICGSTSITDLAGNHLNGGADVILNFRITDPVVADAIPSTGFAPDRVTALPEQTISYTQSDLWLEIPKLGVKMDIVGVPLVDGNWDVSWLGKQAGWLEGSAYPTWDGNSVLTGHVVDANGKAGPFRYLNTLWYGDEIIVHAGGAQYVYAVRSVQQVGPGSTAALLKHEELPWVTLVTCRGYDEASNTYKYRVLVRAVLVKIK